MKRDGALRVIEEEGLKQFVWFKAAAADSLVIHRDGDEWLVFITDDRAAPRGTVNRFNDEATALDEFIERLRRWNQILVNDEKRRRQREERKRRERDGLG